MGASASRAAPVNEYADMDLSNIPVFAALRTKMSYLGSRNKLLAANVANADTPGYKARDLAPLDFKQVLAGKMTAGAAQGASRVAVSEPRHIAPSGAAASSFKAVDAPDADGSVNGNAVTLEDQMLKVADSQMQYQMAAGLYKKSLNMIRTALSRGGE